MTLFDRRQFLSAFGATGLSSTLLPGVVWAQIQQGTRVISVEMIRESAHLAGLEMSDDEARNLATSLSSLSKHAEQIDRPTLTNASPLPLHFDPRPPGIELPALPPAQFRIEPAAAVKLPANLETVAFWSLTQLAELLRTRAVTSTALTKMYLARLKRYNPQINGVASLTEERALREAAAADAAIAGGQYRGTLHGI